MMGGWCWSVVNYGDGGDYGNGIWWNGGGGDGDW